MADRDNRTTSPGFFLIQAFLGLSIAGIRFLDRPLRTLDWIIVVLGLVVTASASMAAVRARRRRRQGAGGAPGTTTVRLRPVDDATLSELVRAALEDAAADEVTPPVTPGNSWTPERIGWLRRFHTESRAGLDGPGGQASWAVELDGAVVGAVRLRRVAPGVLETGIWLTRGARGSGVGRRAVAAVLREAAAAGAREVRADTGRDNHPAIGLLRGLGFETTRRGDRVVARLAPGGSGPIVN
jgi:RimJ/RimL family protein N-acetyltransferase